MVRSMCRVMLAACVSIVANLPLSAEEARHEPPAGPGLELIQQSCVGCHDIYMIIGKRKSPQQWAEILELMAARGAEVTPEEMQIIEEYLSRNFSADAAESTSAHDK